MKLKVQGISIELSSDQVILFLSDKNQLALSPTASNEIRQKLVRELLGPLPEHPSIVKTPIIKAQNTNHKGNPHPPYYNNGKEMVGVWAGRMERWNKTKQCVFCDEQAVEGFKMCESHRKKMFRKKKR